MIQAYADGVLFYDPRLDGYELLELTATVSVEKAGTAEIVMPAGHPAYDAFVSRRTVVTIYKDGELVFRGRALQPADDFDNTRTITCEGERCFLRDAVIQPYLYQADPAVIFASLINLYNSQVGEFKRFELGAITAKDPNDYIRLESESAEQVSEAIDKLVERVGGYIVFSNDATGRRVINWYGSLDNVSSQRIELGENMLNYSRTGAETDFATVIYPYGAKDEETGKRVTIAAVNNGVLYVKDDEAIKRHDVIAVPVFWDDVTLAKNLLTKARKELAKRVQLISTLEITAVDLSAQGVDIDTFRVGDNVPVWSPPHGLDDLFLLTSRDYDFLNEGQDRVVLGKDKVNLTSAAVAGDKQVASQVKQAGGSVTNNYVISGGSDAINWDNVEDKPSTFPPSSHSHAWSTITGKPSTFPPSSHSHAWSTITDKPSVFPVDMELLWENASVESDFAGQTVTIANKSAYRFFVVSMQPSGTTLDASNAVSAIVVNGGGNTLLGIVGSKLARRRVLASGTSSIQFGTGYSFDEYGSSLTENTSVMKPIYLYGIK